MAACRISRAADNALLRRGRADARAAALAALAEGGLDVASMALVSAASAPPAPPPEAVAAAATAWVDEAMSAAAATATTTGFVGTAAPARPPPAVAMALDSVGHGMASLRLFSFHDALRPAYVGTWSARRARAALARAQAVAATEREEDERCPQVGRPLGDLMSLAAAAGDGMPGDAAADAEPYIDVSLRSHRVSARRPLGCDPALFAYEVDSDAEAEAEADAEGEDIEAASAGGGSEEEDEEDGEGGEAGRRRAALDTGGKDAREYDYNGVCRSGGSCRGKRLPGTRGTLPFPLARSLALPRRRH